MGTYTQILYQIVYSTYKRERTLVKKDRQQLFNYIAGILHKKNCFVYKVNGVEDHLHIVSSIHPSISLASLVKDIKLGSTYFINENKILPEFGGWQDGYSAFTYSNSEKNRLIEYVNNQEEHHGSVSFIDELKELLKEHNIEFDEKYLL